MPKILVPFDGSDSARRALQHAISMVKKSPGLELDLLNVVDPDPAGSHVDAPIEEIRKRHEDKASRTLRPARDMVDQAGITCGIHVRAGSPPTEITDLVHEGHYDGVVMGTRGLGPVASVMVGSVALKVVHMVDVPVTLVK